MESNAAGRKMLRNNEANLFVRVRLLTRRHRHHQHRLLRFVGRQSDLPRASPRVARQRRCAVDRRPPSSCVPARLRQLDQVGEYNVCEGCGGWCSCGRPGVDDLDAGVLEVSVIVVRNISPAFRSAIHAATAGVGSGRISSEATFVSMMNIRGRRSREV